MTSGKLNIQAMQGFTWFLIWIRNWALRLNCQNEKNVFSIRRKHFSTLEKHSVSLQFNGCPVVCKIINCVCQCSVYPEVNWRDHARDEIQGKQLSGHSLIRCSYTSIFVPSLCAASPCPAKNACTLL